MITCRNATPQELSTVLNWAADEGWNPGLEDAEPFYAADADRFFVAVDDADVPVASISVVNHTPDFAFLGLYIVRPEYRGRGIGYRLWQHGLLHAGARTVGLDGVEAQQQNYQASGFVHFGGTTRFTGTVQGRNNPDIRMAGHQDTAALIALEAKASGVEKSAYLQSWFAGSTARTTIVFQGDNTLKGFCTVRACRSGAKIGPLIAENATVARHLIEHAATVFAGPLTLDVPGTAVGLTTLCQRLQFAAGFKTARMYRGAFDAVRHDVYAVPSLELG